MFQAAFGLFGCATFHTEHNITGTLVFDNAHNSGPVQHAIATGAAHGRASDLPTFGV